MIKLPAFFSDGMVIQKNAKIWGWCEPRQSVTLKFKDVSCNAMADDTGRFEVTLVTDEFGGPHTLTIGDIIIKDVYVGRVWLCGGQSNMEMSIERARLLLEEHVIDDSRIRAFQVEKDVRFDAPATDVVGKWFTATGDNMNELYATPYFFARQLLSTQDSSDITPIGLICNPAGGTPIQGWLPEEIIKDTKYYEELLTVKEEGYIKRVTGEANQHIQKWNDELDSDDSGLSQGWQAKNYDDSAWQTRMLLDTAGLPEHGSVWLRKTLTLPKINTPVTLKFGRVVNKVKIYVNGEQVISVDYMYPPCTCVIPSDLLVEGENVIAVRIVADDNHPQVIPGKEYALVYDNGRFDLSGEWKWQIGKVMPRLEHSVWFYNRPCGLYNHMLAPLLGYSIDGVIWYQGESNTGSPSDYKELFTKFVNLLRVSFGANSTELSKQQYQQHLEHSNTSIPIDELTDLLTNEKIRKINKLDRFKCGGFGKDLPVIMTQLANFVDPFNPIFGRNWAELREQQRQCYLEIPNTAMAVTIDCGEFHDLHPMDKKTVGERLALHARRLAYKEDVVSDGPMAIEAIQYNSGRIVVQFNHGVGLWAKNGHPILEVVYEDGTLASYTEHHHAKIVGETLVVDNPWDEDITHVRFGWDDCPPVTLYNAYNLPASPFKVKVRSVNF